MVVRRSILLEPLFLVFDVLPLPGFSCEKSVFPLSRMSRIKITLFIPIGAQKIVLNRSNRFHVGHIDNQVELWNRDFRVRADPQELTL
jgi:hypothetical protein